LFFGFNITNRKIEGPINFNYEAKKIGNKTYEVKIKAEIADPWHIYSQYTPKDGPSLPTQIKFVRNPLVELLGEPEEIGELITKRERSLNVTLKYFTEKVEFVQKVKLKANIKTNITGSIEYMACTDDHCLLPTTEKFTIPIK
jgi:thiol:disulfide interchange protein DsbD